MKFKYVIHRIIFYGSLFLVFFGFFDYFDFQLKGSSAFRVFISFSIVLGLIQSFNLAVIKKLEDVKSDIPGRFWSRYRVQHRLEDKRKSSFSRMMYGMFFSIMTAITSVYMFVLGACFVPAWTLGIASLSTLVALYLLFITVFEFRNISNLESELLDQAKNQIRRDEQLKRLKGEDKE